jgi:hypothetical protein
MFGISEFARGEAAETDNIGPIKTGESVDVIFENMQATADYLHESCEALNEFILDSNPGRDLLIGGYDLSLARIEDIKQELDNVALDLKVEIAKNNEPKTILVLSTLRGVLLVDVTIEIFIIEIERYENDEMFTAPSFTSTVLCSQNGKSCHPIGKRKRYLFFFIKATLVKGERDFESVACTSRKISKRY